MCIYFDGEIDRTDEDNDPILWQPGKAYGFLNNDGQTNENSGIYPIHHYDLVQLYSPIPTSVVQVWVDDTQTNQKSVTGFSQDRWFDRNQGISSENIPTDIVCPNQPPWTYFGNNSATSLEQVIYQGLDMWGRVNPLLRDPITDNFPSLISPDITPQAPQS